MALPTRCCDATASTSTSGILPGPVDGPSPWVAMVFSTEPMPGAGPHPKRVRIRSSSFHTVRAATRASSAGSRRRWPNRAMSWSCPTIQAARLTTPRRRKPCVSGSGHKTFRQFLTGCRVTRNAFLSWICRVSVSLAFPRGATPRLPLPVPGSIRASYQPFVTKAGAVCRTAISLHAPGSIYMP